MFGKIDAYDIYGCVEGVKRIVQGQSTYVAYVTTWFGKGSCLFHFLPDVQNVKMELLAAPLQEEDHGPDDGYFRPHELVQRKLDLLP